MVEELQASSDNNENKSVEASKPVEDDPKKPFSIDVLRMIKNAQKQHGLRHGDYQRYRGKLSK